MSKYQPVYGELVQRAEQDRLERERCGGDHASSRPRHGLHSAGMRLVGYADRTVEESERGGLSRGLDDYASGQGQSPDHSRVSMWLDVTRDAMRHYSIADTFLQKNIDCRRQAVQGIQQGRHTACGDVQGALDRDVRDREAVIERANILGDMRERVKRRHREQRRPVSPERARAGALDGIDSSWNAATSALTGVPRREPIAYGGSDVTQGIDREFQGVCDRAEAFREEDERRGVVDEDSRFDMLGKREKSAPVATTGGGRSSKVDAW